VKNRGASGPSALPPLRIAALRRRHPGDHPGDCAAIPLAKRLHFGRRPGHQHLASRHALAEAGEAAGYLANHPGGRLAPDYRGGVSYSRATGRLLGAEAPAGSPKTNGDGVFVSRFQNDSWFTRRIAPATRFPRSAAFAPSSSPPGTSRWIHSASTGPTFVELGPVCAFAWTGLPPRWSSRPPAARRLHSQCGNPRGPNFFGSARRFCMRYTLACCCSPSRQRSSRGRLLPDLWRGPGKLAGHLSSVGFQPQTAGDPPGISVLRAGAAGPAEPWLVRAAPALSSFWKAPPRLPEALGFRPSSRRVGFRMLQDLRRPDLPVIWESALELPLFEIPPAAQVSPGSAGEALAAGRFAMAPAPSCGSLRPRRAWLRALPLSAARARRPGLAPPSARAACGRFSIPPIASAPTSNTWPRWPGRHRRPARRRLAHFRARPAARRLAPPSH